MIIDILGRKFDYKPYKDALYKDKMDIRVLANPTFKRVFKRDKTNDFINVMRNVINPLHKFAENTVWGVSGETGCQPKGSKVLMFDGSWKNIEDIQVGDAIITYDKKFNSKRGTILRTTKWLSTENYDVFQKNRHHQKLYSCSHNHIIPFFRRRALRNPNPPRHVEWVTDQLPIKEFMRFGQRRLAHSIMGITMPAIEHFAQDYNCEIEPYTLGLYISDGSFSHGTSVKGTKFGYLLITKSDERCMGYINRIYPFSRISPKYGTAAKTYAWSLNSNIAVLLKKYGYNMIKAARKFIPKEALFSDLEYRKKLLAGLIDGDGYYARGSYEFTTKSLNLAKGLVFLVYSIGGRVNSMVRKKGKIASTGFEDWYWRISFFIHENLQIPIITKKKTRKSFYLAANKQSIIVRKNENKEYVFGFTVDGGTGFYITDNFILTHNSGKSITIMSLIKLILRKRGIWQLFCFTDKQLLDLASEFERDIFLVRDEDVGKATYGEGSMRTTMQLEVMAETVRKAGISLVFISPRPTVYDIAKYYIETVDMDLNNRITRVALKEATTLQYIGAIYVPVIPEADKDWIEYSKMKDAFIERMKRGEIADTKQDVNNLCQQVLAKCDLSLYRNKNERRTFITTLYPNFTTGEIKTIATLMEIRLRQAAQKQ